MTVLNSSVNVKDETFIANQKAMQEVVDDLYAKVAQIKQGGGPKYQERHLARGKLLARQRIEKLLDSGSPFLEIGQFAV